jgi:6-phosphofructokinase 1
MQDRTIRLDGAALSGILTIGGTLLGTSRDKPNKMPVGGQILDMTEAMFDIYKKHHLDVLVCLGGGGTLKSAYRLSRMGMNVITLPKTIDNDIAMTDVTFGFDTALGIATEAVDRLHSTAHSHHRIIVVEIMGHNAGWLALGAGIAGGADVILIPEIPYNVEEIADAIMTRSREGKRFSIVAVAEGALSIEDANILAQAKAKVENAEKDGSKKEAKLKVEDFWTHHLGNTQRLANQLETLTGLESRLTILGHLQRGGIPSAADRLLATKLGTACANFIQKDVFGVMVASRGDGVEPVPLELAAGKKKLVPPDHPWIESARLIGTNLGD